MKREIIITSDGSTTIHLPDWNEQYHSKHGAIQEAYHVFIKSGLDQLDTDEISILEIGFGTGLNAFITFLESQNRNLKIDYVGVEAYPVASDEVEKLNYVTELKAESFSDAFQKMYEALKEDGILTTYAAKGSVRRAMIAVGFEVERLPGPPGKREMLRAKKVLTSS